MVKAAEDFIGLGEVKPGFNFTAKMNTARQKMQLWLQQLPSLRSVINLYKCMTKDGIAILAEKHITGQLGASGKNITHGSEHVNKSFVDDLAAKMVELGQITTATKNATEDKKVHKQAMKEQKKAFDNAGMAAATNGHGYHCRRKRGHQDLRSPSSSDSEHSSPGRIDINAHMVAQRESTKEMLSLRKRKATLMEDVLKAKIKMKQQKLDHKIQQEKHQQQQKSASKSSESGALELIIKLTKAYDGLMKAGLKSNAAIVQTKIDEAMKQL
jgi:hypothetical protein